MRNIKSLIFRLIDAIDLRASGLKLKTCSDRGNLVTVLFHGLFNCDSDMESQAVVPGQRVTVDLFEQFVKHCLSDGYKFIVPSDLVNGLIEPSERCVMITFDDGYLSHQLALPIQEKYNVPAVCYVSTAHVSGEKCFWWDVLHRELWKIGSSFEQIETEVERYKKLKIKDIEVDLVRRFGETCFEPLGKIDRPMTIRELIEYSRHPLIEVGNHTHRHEILSLLDLEEAIETIMVAQKCLTEWTGQPPVSFSFPNGNLHCSGLNLLEQVGIPIGIGLEPRTNKIEQNSVDSCFRILNRHILWGDRNIPDQWLKIRSNLQLLDRIARIKNKILFRKEETA